jgi:hypothetical protein
MQSPPDELDEDCCDDEELLALVELSDPAETDVLDELDELEKEDEDADDPDDPDEELSDEELSDEDDDADEDREDEEFADEDENDEDEDDPQQQHVAFSIRDPIAIDRYVSYLRHAAYLSRRRVNVFRVKEVPRRVEDEIGRLDHDIAIVAPYAGHHGDDLLGARVARRGTHPGLGTFAAGTHVGGVRFVGVHCVGDVDQVQLMGHPAIRR